MTQFNQTPGFTIEQLQAQILEEEVIKMMNMVRAKLLTALKDDPRKVKTEHKVQISTSDFASTELANAAVVEVEYRLKHAQEPAGTPGAWELQPLSRSQGDFYFLFRRNP